MRTKRSGKDEMEMRTICANAGILRTGSLLLLLGSAVVAATAARAEDIGRGRLLYETYCVYCHTTKIHSGDAPRVKSWEQLLFEVSRWQREVKQNWGPDDIDAVAHYLDDRYYKLPCPSLTC